MCRVEGCRYTAKQNYKFCNAHICKISKCPNKSTDGATRCIAHLPCESPRCQQYRKAYPEGTKSGVSLYCDKHVCRSEGCEGERISGSKYCYRRKGPSSVLRTYEPKRKKKKTTEEKKKRKKTDPFFRHVPSLGLSRIRQRQIRPRLLPRAPVPRALLPGPASPRQQELRCALLLQAELPQRAS